MKVSVVEYEGSMSLLNRDCETLESLSIVIIVSI